MQGKVLVHDEATFKDPILVNFYDQSNKVRKYNRVVNRQEIEY
jgi:hypothetical protein